jgi:hypothetical protein
MSAERLTTSDEPVGQLEVIHDTAREMEPRCVLFAPGGLCFLHFRCADQSEGDGAHKLYLGALVHVGYGSSHPTKTPTMKPDIAVST